MNALSKRNAAIGALNDKLNTNIPFEEEGVTTSKLNPEMLMFQAEALAQKTALPLTVRGETLGAVETAIKRQERDIENGFSMNYFLNEDEMEMEILDLNAEQLLTVRTGLLWDTEEISVTISDDYEDKIHKETESVGMLELEDSLEIVENGIKVQEFSDSKIATLLNLQETLEQIRLIADNESRYPLDHSVSADDLPLLDLAEITHYGIQDLPELNEKALTDELKPAPKVKERLVEFSM
ncbi:hypothetical protein LMH73_017885 [Vibrio splendidus]|nr:hypothetical protein [Vibrio splendidus]MCC4883312.1 hypothetical protein [Vibrio splendidus]